MIATLTIAQLQSLVIAVAAALTVIIPIITAVVLLAIRNFGRIEQAVGELRGHAALVDGQVDTLRSIADKIANPHAEDV